MSLEVECLFHEPTNTATYIASDPATKKCAIIDPVTDLDLASGKYGFQHAASVVKYVTDKNLVVEWILETHAHADHLTGAFHLREEHFPDSNVAIGKNIQIVQKLFKGVFNIDESFPCDGSQFNHLFEDNEEFSIGSIKGKAMHTPGHTPDSMSYHIGDCLFSGDTLFMPDSGTGRCDFPNGSAKQLFHSIERMYALPDSTRNFVGHDYAAGGRKFQWETTIGEQKKSNKHVMVDTTEAEFVKVREERDATLTAPKLLLPSLQVNIRAGRLPEPESNGVSYLKVPLKQ